jgi:muramidase (phage lysozyme)
MAALSPYARALLNTIAGTESPGYNVMYGGGRFNDYSHHPDQAVRIQTGPNAGRTSSAAGRYQFLNSTWQDEANKLGLKDFSPDSQDQAAWDLASSTYKAKTGQDLNSVLASGDRASLAGVGNALAGQWTSLPGGIEQGQNQHQKPTVQEACAASPRPIPSA